MQTQYKVMHSWGPVKKNPSSSHWVDGFGAQDAKPNLNVRNNSADLLRYEVSAVCRIHGGRSTGPRTQQGRNLCGAAKTLHGRETRAIRAKRQQALAELKLLERMGKGAGVF